MSVSIQMISQCYLFQSSAIALTQTTECKSGFIMCQFFGYFISVQRYDRSVPLAASKGGCLLVIVLHLRQAVPDLIFIKRGT